MKSALFSTGLLIAATVSLSASPLVRPSMEETFSELRALYDQALSASRVPQRSLAQLQQARLSERIAQANKYPRVSAGMNVGVNQFRPDGEPNTSSIGLDFNVALSQSLYQWGALRARREMGRINREIAELNEEQRLQGIAQEVRMYFSHLVLDRVQMQADAIEEYLLRNNLDFQRREFEAGRLSANAFEDHVLANRNATLGIRQRSSATRERLAQLNRLLGVETITLDDIPEVYPALPGVGDGSENVVTRAFSQTAPEERIAVQRLLLQAEMSDQRLIEARSFQRPHISLFASAGQGRTNTSRQDNVSQIILFGGISVSWNIFDGFASQNERRLRSAQARAIEFQTWEQLRQLEIQNSQLLERVQFAIERLETAERRFNLERIRFEDSIRQAEEGRLSDLDFAGVQLALLRQEYSLYSERRSFQLIWGEFLMNLRQDPALAYFELNGSSS